MNLSLVGLVVLVLALGLLVASVIGLAWLWWRVLHRPKGDLAVCGKCGYGVRGVGSLTCPECGADLREAGIVTPGRRGMVRPLAFVLLWTVLLVPPAAVVSLIALGLGPQVSTYGVFIDLQPTTAASSYTVNLRVYAAEAHVGVASFPSSRPMPHGSGGSWIVAPLAPGQVPHSIDLEVSSSSQPGAVQERAMRIDPAAGTYRYTRSGGPSASGRTPVEAAAMEQWLSSAGVAGGPQRSAEAAELAMCINALIAGQSPVGVTLFSANYRGSSYSGHAAPWFVLALWALWIAVWAGGMALYFRQYRRRSVHRKMD
jgi:hypothetical protein